jgi:hypothetical protein
VGNFAAVIPNLDRPNVVHVATWGTPYRTVQAGVNAAIAKFTCTADSPGIVMVHPGTTYQETFTHPTIGSRSVALDMSGASTGEDGQNGGGDHIAIIGATGDPRDVVIEFVGLPVNNGINSRCIEAMSHVRFENITFRCNLLNRNEDSTNGVGRFIHWDSSTADATDPNYIDVNNCIFESTTAINAGSQGIHAGQRCSWTNIGLKGACSIAVHGNNTGGNASPAIVIYEGIWWDGSIYTGNSGLRYHAGLEIDGQVTPTGAITHPCHNLIAFVRNCNMGQQMSAESGYLALDIKHPLDGGSGVGISSCTQASPSVVTTYAAHGLSVGDVVQIVGHSVDAMNGYWTVASVPLTTTFTATSCNNTSGANGTASGSVFKQVQIAASTAQTSTVTILSSTVASPAVFTTDGDHSLTAAGSAVGLLTLTNQPSDTQTCTIDAKVYTFQTVLTEADGNVAIGGTTADTVANLIAAVNLGAGGGTAYANAMTLHPTVTASAGSGTTMVATAKTGGTAGNSIATTETMSNATWGMTTLNGGVAATVVIVASHSDARMNGIFAIASIPTSTTFTLTGCNGLGDNNGDAATGGTVRVATVIATQSVHNLAVGDPVIVGEHIATTNATNGPYIVKVVPSTTTFVAEACANTSTAGGATGHVIKDLSWIYVLDGSIPPREAGVAGMRLWNSIHWPQKRHWAAKTGTAYKAGEVGIYDNTSTVESFTRTSVAGGGDWPVVISRPLLGRDNVGTRYPKLNTGSHANLLFTAGAVAKGDTIITGTTQGQCIVDNTVTLILNPQKIVGWAVTGKRSSQLGACRVILNPLCTGRL